MRAARYNHLSTVQYLVDQEADVDAKDVVWLCLCINAVSDS